MVKIYLVAWSGSAGIFEAESAEDALEKARKFSAWDGCSTITASLLTLGEKGKAGEACQQ